MTARWNGHKARDHRSRLRFNIRERETAGYWGIFVAIRQHIFEQTMGHFSTIIVATKLEILAETLGEKKWSKFDETLANFPDVFVTTRPDISKKTKHRDPFQPFLCQHN